MAEARLGIGGGFARGVAETTSTTGDARLRWAWAGLIAAVVGIVFQSASQGALLAWDDDINITLNPHLRALSWDNLQWMFTDFAYMRRYVPLTWLNWALDHAWFGLTARSCHIGNIVFHAANSVLVFLVVARVLKLWRARHGAKPGEERAVVCAAGLAALIWAVHPLRVEVVAWASGRIYCQAAFFLLLATLAYLNAGAAPGGGRQRGWYALAIAAFAASLLTYPIGISYPALLVVIDGYLLRRFAAGVGAWREPETRRAWLEKIPFVAVTLLVVGVTVFARFQARGVWEPPPTLAEFGIGSRVAQAFYIWGYYLWRPWVPVDLAPVYTTLVKFEPTDLPFVTAAVILVIVTAWLVTKRRAWPAALALWIAHLVLLAPMLGFTEHPHYPNDRYGYLPGVLWAIVAAGAMLWLRPRAWVAALAGAVALVAILGALSVAQIRIWRDDETLFRHLYERLEGNDYRADMAARLGETLFGRRRFNEAALFYHEVLGLDPSAKLAGVAHYRLGMLAERSGQREAAERRYAEALRFDPARNEAREALARLRATER